MYSVKERPQKHRNELVGMLAYCFVFLLTTKSPHVVSQDLTWCALLTSSLYLGSKTIALLGKAVETGFKKLVSSILQSTQHQGTSKQLSPRRL